MLDEAKQLAFVDIDQSSFEIRTFHRRRSARLVGEPNADEALQFQGLSTRAGEATKCAFGNELVARKVPSAQLEPAGGE